MGVGPRAVVTAPPAAAPVYGLIPAVQVLRGNDKTLVGRWETGFAYLPESCATAAVLDPCDHSAKPGADAPSTIDYDPVVIMTQDTCSTFDEPRDWIGRATRLLTACQSKQLASELWTGALTQASANIDNAWLASLAANVVTNGAVAEVNALACLEDALASCSCGRGMIHCTPGTLVRWATSDSIRYENGLWLTPMGSVVIADNGYDGSGPDGQAAASGSVWAYGTDLVAVRLGDIQVFPPEGIGIGSVDRSLDTVVVRAERLAAATFGPCCLVAAELDITICADLAAS